MRQLVWLDLYSGIGGASQPAKDRGWRVIRVEKEKRFKPDVVADVQFPPFRWFHVDVLWASPPCIDYTRWGMRKYASWAFTGKHKVTEPSPALTIAALNLVDFFKPAVWIIENVAFSREFLTPILGPVRAISGGHVLWGNLPCLIPQTQTHKWKIPPGPEQSAIRAAIPYEIGDTICRAVEQRSQVNKAIEEQNQR